MDVAQDARRSRPDSQQVLERGQRLRVVGQVDRPRDPVGDEGTACERERRQDQNHRRQPPDAPVRRPRRARAEWLRRKGTPAESRDFKLLWRIFRYPATLSASATGQRGGDGGGDLREGRRVRAVRLGDHDRHAGVAALGDRGVERNEPRNGHAELGAPCARRRRAGRRASRGRSAGRRRSTCSRRCRAPARSTLVNMASPLRASISATSCGVVTMTAPESGDLLRQRELGVAGARRQVDHQEVERAPLDVGEELLDRLHHHRTAPDHRRVGVEDRSRAT